MRADSGSAALPGHAHEPRSAHAGRAGLRVRIARGLEKSSTRGLQHSGRDAVRGAGAGNGSSTLLRARGGPGTKTSLLLLLEGESGGRELTLAAFFVPRSLGGPPTKPARVPHRGRRLASRPHACRDAIDQAATRIARGRFRVGGFAAGMSARSRVEPRARLAREFSDLAAEVVPRLVGPCDEDPCAPPRRASRALTRRPWL